jgi:hypothetical protein
LHGWAARAIQQPKLNAGAINDTAHDAAQRVNLAHNVAFPDTANCGIAGHLADQIEVQGDERCVRAEPRGSRSGLAAGMASADYNHVKDFIEYHDSKITCRYRRWKKFFPGFRQRLFLR